MVVSTPEQLAAALAPVVKYHPRERYFLDDAEDYFERTKPHTSADGEKARVMKEGLALENYTYPEPKETVPAFFHVAMNPDWENHYYIVYYLFYPYNGPKRVFGLVPTGAHTADIETITVKVRTSDNQVLEYMMTNHGDNVAYALDNGVEEGATAPRNALLGEAPGRVGPEDAPLVGLDEEGRPVVYTSLNGHGLYNEPGSYIRLGGAGNDVTADGGPSTRVRPIKLPLDSPLLLWKGRFGDDGVNGYYKRRNPEDEKPAIPRHARVPGALASLAYGLYALLPLAAYGLARWLGGLGALLSAGVAAVVFVAQFYVLKAALTIIFPLVGAPKPDPDDWWRWLLPLRLD